MFGREKLSAKAHEAKPIATIIGGIAASLVLVGVVAYPYLSHKSKSLPPATQSELNLLQGYDWSDFAGASVSPAGVHITGLGRAIVNQDGSPNQNDPPVNFAGPHLDVSGDFEVTAEVSNFQNVGTLQLYDQVPGIYDEWRQETPSIAVSQSDGEVYVDEWNGLSDKPKIDTKFAYSPPIEKLSIARVGKNIEIAANGGRTSIGQLPDIFKDNTVWFGTDAKLNTSGWTIKTLAANALKGGNVKIVGAPNLIVPHSDPNLLRNLAAKQTHPIDIGAAVSLEPYFTDPEYRADTAQFNVWTTENVFKQQFIHPQPNKWDWHEADLFVKIAHENGDQVYGHTIVFGEANPAWEQNTPVNQRKALMENNIKTELTHFGSNVKVWYLTDELLNDNDDGWRNTIWYQGMGPQVPVDAFRTAETTLPGDEYCINEFGLENNPDALQFVIKNIIIPVQAAGYKVDCIGLEEHVYDPSTDSFTAQNIQYIANTLAPYGVKVIGSEFDDSGDDDGAPQEKQFVATYQGCEISATCITQFQWGVTNGHASTVTYHQYPVSGGDGLMFGTHGEPNGNFYCVQAYFKTGAIMCK